MSSNNPTSPSSAVPAASLLSSSAPASSSHFPPHLQHPTTVSADPAVPTTTTTLTTTTTSSTTVGVSSKQPAATAIVYRIQIFPHREGFGNPLSGPLPPAGFNFSPIEMDLTPNVVVRIGRKVDRQKDKEGKDKKNAAAAAVMAAVAGGAGTSSAAPAAAPTARPSTAGTNGTTAPAPAAGTGATASTRASAAAAAAATGPSGTVIGNNDLEHILRVVERGSEPSENDADVMSPYAAAAQAAAQNGDTNAGDRRGSEAGPDASASAAASSSSSAAKTQPAAPKDFIAFRSKVVSRTHAELWLTEDGQVMFKDVGSSSGTFLNRLRLSPSGRESRPYPIKSGDVIQLGVDYQGRQDEIYKCVQMKVFVSQKSRDRPKTNPARLRLALKILLAAMNPGARDASDASCTDCCICLSTLSPQQALFLAPCSHCFHYRCVMPLLGSNIMFQCPLCRQVANLDANVVEEDNGGATDYLSSSSDDGLENGRSDDGRGGGGVGVTVDEEWARSILSFEGLSLADRSAQQRAAAAVAAAMAAAATGLPPSGAASGGGNVSAMFVDAPTSFAGEGGSPAVPASASAAQANGGLAGALGPSTASSASSLTSASSMDSSPMQYAGDVNAGRGAGGDPNDPTFMDVEEGA
ncbi:hypothetical protein HDU96_010122 [Phlyctochytrium bullatum]|nr:hypothetical protein HDU96_010122 [Phlyctochytrium bullatum]